MNLDIHVYHHLLVEDDRLDRSLSELEKRIMSVLDDHIAALKQASDTYIAANSERFETLTGQLDALRAKVDAGIATPAQIAALDLIAQNLKVINPNDPTVLSDVKPTPAPSVDTAAGVPTTDTPAPTTDAVPGPATTTTTTNTPANQAQTSEVERARGQATQDVPAPGGDAAPAVFQP